MKIYKGKCPELKISFDRQQIHKARIGTSREAAQFFRQFWEGMDLYESFYVVYLNANNNTIGWYKASQGGITGTVADPRMIFCKALQCGATRLMMAHNHPSGNFRPSEADISLTKKIREGGKFLDIMVLEHIILTEDGYYSFADEGLI